MMNEFYCNNDATKKNYLIVSPEHDGRFHIEKDAKTDYELGEMTDFYDFTAMSSLGVGESCTIADGCAMVLRIS